jgi:cytochrome c553
MKPLKTLIIAFLGLLLVGAICAVVLKWRGFRATSTPSTFETAAARSVRDFAIPIEERRKKNPEAGDSLAIQQGREDFLARCASCHGVDARGRTPIGANEYPACRIFTSPPRRT